MTGVVTKITAARKVTKGAVEPAGLATENPLLPHCGFGLPTVEGGAHLFLLLLQ